MSTGRTAVLIAVVLICLAVVVAAVPALNVALPNVAEKTGATQSQLQWVVDAYAVVFASLLLPCGALGDRYGRKPILVLGLAIFATGSLAACFMSTPEPLIAMRAVMGVGAAMVMPTTLSILTTSLPEGRRERAVAAWVGVAGAGAILGLLASGLLLEGFDWPSIFLLNVVLGALLLIAALVVVPNSRHDNPPRIDYVGTVLSTVGLTGLVFGAIEGPDRGWTDGITLTAFAVGVVALAVWTLWSLRVQEPLLDPRLFRRRDFANGTLSLTVQFFAFFGFVFVIMQYLQLVRGYSPLQAALGLVPMGMLVGGLSRQAPKLIAHRGRRPVAIIGLLLMTAGFVVLSRLDGSSSYWLVLGGIVPLGAGLALATVPATTGIISSLPPEKQGVASAVNDAAREVGGTLGIAVLGSVLAAAFKNGVLDAVPAGAPAAMRDAAGDSLPGALAIAAKIGPQGADLASVARSSFVDGLSNACLTAAVALAVTAVVVAVHGGRKEANGGKDEPATD